MHFFFPIGVFQPLVADLYILSRMLKGHAGAFWNGESFHLDDDLFSLQRTFALLEAQTESVSTKRSMRSNDDFKLAYYKVFSS